VLNGNLFLYRDGEWSVALGDATYDRLLYVAATSPLRAEQIVMFGAPDVREEHLKALIARYPTEISAAIAADGTLVPPLVVETLADRAWERARLCFEMMGEGVSLPQSALAELQGRGQDFSTALQALCAYASHRVAVAKHAATLLDSATEKTTVNALSKLVMEMAMLLEGLRTSYIEYVPSLGDVLKNCSTSGLFYAGLSRYQGQVPPDEFKKYKDGLAGAVARWSQQWSADAKDTVRERLPVVCAQAFERNLVMGSFWDGETGRAILSCLPKR
jgi:hypothetical protein